MKKKKSHKLSIEPDYRFFLIGISSHENDYHLCWAINRKLGLTLQKTANFVVFNPKRKANQEFSMYFFEDEESLLTYHLLSNRCDDGFLIDEFRNIDFLIQVHGDFPEAAQKKLIRDLKAIEIISTSFDIDPHALKSPDRLLIQ
jgi:hypothetical protein